MSNVNILGGIVVGAVLAEVIVFAAQGSFAPGPGHALIIVFGIFAGCVGGSFSD